MPDRVDLHGLRVRLGEHTLVDGVDLALRPGEVVALAGPSGSGKTLTARSLLGLVDLAPGAEGTLEVEVDGVVHTPYAAPLPSRRARDRAFRAVRGRALGYLPQDAPRSLDPLARIGAQLQRVARLAGDARPVVDWLVRAGFPAAEAARVAGLHPHALSGGMAQRAGIALALARGSRFLVADEPTTGLDAPVQRQLLDAFRALADQGLGILLVTHDLRWLAALADTVHVMDAGRQVESLDATTLAQGTPRSATARRLVEAARAFASPGFP